MVDGWASSHPNWVEKLQRNERRYIVLVHTESGRAPWRLWLFDGDSLVLRGQFRFSSLEHARDAKRSIYRAAGIFARKGEPR